MTSSPTLAEETKEVISILLSLHPLCTVSQLCNDFFMHVGYKVPFKPLGFRSITEYLRSLPDILVVRRTHTLVPRGCSCSIEMFVSVYGEGYYAKVERVTKPNPAHIEEMVDSKSNTSKIPPHERKSLKDCEYYPSYEFEKSKIQPDYPSDTSSDSQTIEDKNCNENIASKDQKIEKVAPKISPSVLINLKKDKLLEDKFLEVLKVCSESHGYKSINEICADIPQVFNKPTVTPKNSQPQKCLTIVPPNVFRLGDKIPRYSVDDIKVHEHIYIGMGEIYDISKFWIFFENGQLQSLMSDLQSYFCNPDNKFPVPEAMLQENLFCVCLYAQEYHRAMIVDLAHTTPGLVRVLFVDFGTVENVCTTAIWLLPKHFGNVTCQLVRARLANVCPPYENFPWSYKSTKRFRELTNNATTLIAQVAKVVKEDISLELYIADFSDDESKISYINDALVTEGLAVYADKERISLMLDPKPKMANLHLHPEFHEIEAGKAPTPTEMDCLMENNLPMHHYLPQYFDITLKEDCDKIERDYEELVASATDFQIDVTQIEHDFDHSMFSSEIVNEIQEFAKQDISIKLVVLNSYTESSSKSSCDDEEVVSVATTQSLPCDEEVVPLITTQTSSKSSCGEDVPLNDSLEKLSLSESDDQSVFDNNSSKNNSSNPFLNDLNQSRSTNPFRNNTNIEEETNACALLDIFPKPSQDSHDKNLNLTPCLGGSQPCKSNSTNPFLNNNDQKETVTCKSSNPFRNSNIETVESPGARVLGPLQNQNIETLPRVRPPPGFSPDSLHSAMPFCLQQLNPNNMYHYQNYYPTFWANNPYYQRWLMFNPNFAVFPGNPYFSPQFQFNVRYLHAQVPQPQQSEENEQFTH